MSSTSNLLLSNQANPIPLGEVKFAIRGNSKNTIKGRIELEVSDHNQNQSFYIIYSGYNVWLKDEIKSMAGSKWLGWAKDLSGNVNKNPRKAWAVEANDRNRFQLSYLLGLDPYKDYDSILPSFIPRRLIKVNGENKSIPYSHQNEMTSHILMRRQCIIAGEPGVGKTLAAIEAMERSGFNQSESLWVGPRSALDAVKYDFARWQVCSICGKLGRHHYNEDHRIIDRLMVWPSKFVTYEELKKIVEQWPSGKSVYKQIIFDECQKIKTVTAQRTQAAKHIADSMRNEWGRDAIICLMSGTPSPKSPSDWFSLAEIACPGFIREGTLQKFNNRLCKTERYESLGGTYPKLIGWWDDENKCQICCKMEDDPNHDNMSINMGESWAHPFRKSVNEVQKLYERMKGLVIVKLKRECLDLPEKVYQRIICKPTPSTLRAASLIAKTSRSVIRALTLQRELSDGFQYREVEDGETTCPTCKGKLIITRTVDLDDPTNPLDSESLTRGHRALWSNTNEDNNDSYVLLGFKDEPLRLGEQEIDCTQCGGTGTVPNYIRTAIRVDCPKDEAVINLLDQYEEQSRVVFWGGFTESVERLTDVCIKAGWGVIRLDGRGWWSNLVTSSTKKSLGQACLEAYDIANINNYPKLAFVGQPGAGGMGLNLTASSMECFYSNTFKGEDRGQAIERIHRPGADHNRGCTIYDLIHLPQDDYVLENVSRKRDLERLTMGQVLEGIQKCEDKLMREI